MPVGLDARATLLCSIISLPDSEGNKTLRPILLALIVAGGLTAEAAARDSLRDVLRRAGEYVVDYGEQLASVIADEHYTQQLVAAADGSVITTRVLRSEIAFVHLADSQEWQAFRSVVDVDGRPLGGAAGRLERVFRGAPRSIMGQARAIAEASAAYNLGPLRRDFNAPTMPLQFLHPGHQDRFRFDKRTEEALPGGRAWVVRFRERDRATIIRTPDGRPVPVEGLAWLIPESGRVSRLSFFAKDFLPADPGPKTSRADVDVIWRDEPRLNLWVPAEMHERYSGPWTDGGRRFDIAGTAVYSNYRRFDVDVRMIDRR